MPEESPRLAVDVIVEKDSRVLLIQRKNPPFKGLFALPGGMVEVGETVENAALRELKEETGVAAELKGILGVYSDPKRDPRGHVVPVVFVATHKKGEPKGGDDAAAASWFHEDELDEHDLAFDHWKILQDYFKWKKSGGTFWSSK